MLLDTPQDTGHKDRCGRILTAKPLGPPAPEDMTAQSVGGVGQEMGQRWTGQKLQKEMAEERQRRGQDRPRLGKTGPRWGQNGPKMGPLWSKMEPRWAKTGPRWSRGVPRWNLDGARSDKMGQQRRPRQSKMGQDAAKTRENESKKCGQSRQIRCFRKVGAMQRPRRAKNVRMKQVLVRGRPDRREKEPKCGHCRGPKRCGAKQFLQD